MTGKTFLAAVAQPAPPAGPKEILEMQRRLTEEGNSLAQVNAKISEIEKEIERLRGSSPPAPDFDAPRESLLADVALDKATKSDLAKFDSEAAAAMKTYDAIVKTLREKVSPLESTFAGLRRKAANSNRTIENLRIEHRKICLAHLIALAEREGGRYAEAIHAAVGAFAHAVALGSLHKRAGGENHIGENYEMFDVIGLGLASTKGLPQTDPVTWGKRFDAAESAVLDGLKSEGIAIPFPSVDVAAPKATPEAFAITPLRQEDLIDQLRPPDRIYPEDADSRFNPFTGKADG